MSRMFLTIREVLDRRELLYMITWREIKVKYKQTVMGVLWAVLMPLIIVCASLVARVALAEMSKTSLAWSDLASVTVKAAPWAFFVSALRFGTNSLVANTDLITKVYLPRVIFPLAAVLSQLVDFLIAGAVVSLFLVVVRVGYSVYLFWLPVLLAPLIVLAMAFAIVLSAASLFLRDVKYIVEVFLTFAIFFTPVFYDTSVFGQWAPILLLNPVSPLLEGLSATVILHRSPSLLWVSYSFVVTALLIAVAVRTFRKLEPFFAEIA